MSYSVCRFWAYDESKKYLGAGTWYILFVAFHLFTGSKALPLPRGSWHWPGVWVRNIIALTHPPWIRALTLHQLVELQGLSEILEVRDYGSRCSVQAN
jgi:hypothetical protein